MSESKAYTRVRVLELVIATVEEAFQLPRQDRLGRETTDGVLWPPADGTERTVT